MAVKDYILQVKVKNGPMLSAMRASGMETAADLSRATGVAPTIIGHFLNLLRTPVTRHGEWKLPVMQIAEALNVIPEMLFPEQHLSKALEKNKVEIELDLEDMEQLTSGISGEMVINGIDDAQKTEAVDLLRGALDTIPARSQEILAMRYGLGGDAPSTLAATADAFSVSPERIRQIEAKALRKLRHPKRLGDHERMIPLKARQKKYQEEIERESALLWVPSNRCPQGGER